jgi:phosphoglucosamine mutase
MVSSMSPELKPADPSPWIRTDLPAAALFGTDGIRGRVGDLLTAPLAVQIGYWTGQVLRAEAGPGRHSVYLGQDSRSSGDMLASAIAAGLCAAGVDVLLLGLCPTPCVAYLTHKGDPIGGMMISASHNPPADNGIKVFGASGTKLSTALQAKIEAGIRGQWTTPQPVSVGHCRSAHDRVADYARAIQESVGTRLEGSKVVLDLAWGAAAELGPAVFKAMGAEVICLHDRPDGERINVGCGSTHLQSLQAAVLEHGADLGFGFDGDADRVLSVDDRGQVVDGDYMLFLWGLDLMDKGLLPGNQIVTTVMANLGFERAWLDIDGVFIRTNVGDQYVQAEMQRSGAMLGGEQSGHLLCRHYALTGDGLLSALHLTALVLRSGQSLSELVAGCFITYPQILRNIRVEDRDRLLNWQNCTELMHAIHDAEAALGDRGRVLVRPSGTEPLIRVMVEAENKELVEFWIAKLCRTINTILTHDSSL